MTKRICDVDGCDCVDGSTPLHAAIREASLLSPSCDNYCFNVGDITTRCRSDDCPLPTAFHITHLCVDCYGDEIDRRLAIECKVRHAKLSTRDMVALCATCYDRSARSRLRPAGTASEMPVELKR